MSSKREKSDIGTLEEAIKATELENIGARGGETNFNAMAMNTRGRKRAVEEESEPEIGLPESTVPTTKQTVRANKKAKVAANSEIILKDKPPTFDKSTMNAAKSTGTVIVKKSEDSGATIARKAVKATLDIHTEAKEINLEPGLLPQTLIHSKTVSDVKFQVATHEVDSEPEPSQNIANLAKRLSRHEVGAKAENYSEVTSITVMAKPKTKAYTGGENTFLPNFKDLAISKRAQRGKTQSADKISDDRPEETARIIYRGEDKTVLDNDTDDKAMTSHEDDEEDYKDMKKRKGGKGKKKIIPRLENGKVTGIDLTPEEFLERQKKGHWKNGTIGKNTDPNRRKRRMGPSPTKMEDMDEGDWIIVRLHLENKGWKEIDAAWSDWSEKRTDVTDFSVVRNRYEILENMMCKELNLDINTDLMLRALKVMANEKKQLQDELNDFTQMQMARIQKLGTEKWDRLPGLMKTMGDTDQEFDRTAIAARFHYLSNKHFMSYDGEWLASPLDLTTPGASTATRKRAPKKRYVPSSAAIATAATNSNGESSVAHASSGKVANGGDVAEEEDADDEREE